VRFTGEDRNPLAFHQLSLSHRPLRLLHSSIVNLHNKRRLHFSLCTPHPKPQEDETVPYGHRPVFHFPLTRRHFTSWAGELTPHSKSRSGIIDLQSLKVQLIFDIRSVTATSSFERDTHGSNTIPHSSWRHDHESHHSWQRYVEQTQACETLHRHLLQTR